MKSIYIFLLLISSSKLACAQSIPVYIGSDSTVQTPKAVIEAFRKLVPNSIDVTYWTQYSRVNPYVAGQGMDYGFEFHIPSGSSATVGSEAVPGGYALFTSTGYLFEYRISIQMDSLPGTVRKAFTKNAKRRKIDVRRATIAEWTKELKESDEILETTAPDRIMYSGKFYGKFIEGCDGPSIYNILINSKGCVKMQSEECP
jgi:hypothetical protein